MAVARDVAPGTKIMTSERREGVVLRSYPGTSVVTVRVQGAILSVMRHDLHYAEHHQTEFPTLTWRGE